jgi:hypothetical protein
LLPKLLAAPANEELENDHHYRDHHGNVGTDLTTQEGIPMTIGTVDYGELSVPDLAKLINDEYSLVLASERNNLQRALTIGEKLLALRARAKHGEWQEKLKGWCPKLSYETATLYIRLFEKRDEWEERAKTESVETTDLTIERVRQLLAKPRPKPDTDSTEDDEGDDAEDADSAISRGEVSPGADKVVANLELDTGDMFEVLKKVYDHDDLTDIAKRLATHLGMTLVPARAQQPTAGAPIGAAPMERRL